MLLNWLQIINSTFKEQSVADMMQTLSMLVTIENEFKWEKCSKAVVAVCLI